MVEITLPIVLQILQTAGILVGIVYYITTLRNQAKNRTLGMVFQRMQMRTPEWFQMYYDVAPMYQGWDTVEEFYERYNPDITPELSAKRATILYHLDSWGYLLREGLVEADLIFRLHPPLSIIRHWEWNEEIILDRRKRRGRPDDRVDFEYLYNVTKSKYPHLSKDTPFER